MGPDALLDEHAMQTLSGFYNRTAKVRRTTGELKEDSDTSPAG